MITKKISTVIKYRFTCFLLVAISFFTSCNSTVRPQRLAASAEIIIDSSAGSCTNLVKDNNNNIILSWIRHINDTTNIFCYAISTNEGKTFSAPVEIPGSSNIHPHGENLPKVIVTATGEIFAAWGTANPNPKNKYAGAVYYARSVDKGKTWTAALPITSDSSSYDQRYFDMALLPGGDVAIVWLDNRKQWKKEGSGLFYAVAKKNTGFRDERLISGPCCQCCRTDLYVDKKQNLHVLYRAIINDSIRDMVHIVSTDQGKTFSPAKRISQDNWVISGCPHTGPAMTETSHGAHFTWFTAGGGPGIYYNQSFNNGKSFTKRELVSGGSAKHSQLTTLSSGHVVIVWEEAVSSGNNFSNRIAVQLRNPDGKALSKDYISSPGSSSSYPVIFPTSGNKALLAYTEITEDKKQVLLQQIELK